MLLLLDSLLQESTLRQDGGYAANHKPAQPKTSASQSQARTLPRPTQTQFQDSTQLLTTNTMLWWLVQVALAFVPHLVSSRRVSRLLSSPSSSPLAATLLLLKAASMQPLATWNLMIGDGTCMTLSKAPTGWEIRMQSTTRPERRVPPSLSWRTTGCLSAGLPRARSTSSPLAASLTSTGREGRLTGAAALLTGPVPRSSTHCTARASAMIATTSSSTLPSTF